EGDADDPGGDRAPAGPLDVPGDRPDAGRDGEDAEQQRQGDAPGGDRRQREPAGHEAEDDPDGCDVARAYQLGDALAGRRDRRRCQPAPNIRLIGTFLRARQTESTSRSAPTNSTTRPWIIRLRLPASRGSKTLGSSERLAVPVDSAPKRRAAKRTPTALFRPSRATAIPMNPTPVAASLEMSGTPMWNRQPSSSTAPARPAKP